jgi:putative protease
MRRKGKLPELLCPAGSFECLVAAVEAGADAVYLGGKRFGARAYAKNFDTEELARAVSYCHLHGVKLYVTLNTLIYDKELSDAVSYAAELYEMGVDALIIADLGAVREIRRQVPRLPLHASTQMSLHNAAGVDVAERLGCERAVVARELSFADIKKITEGTGIEIEVFLHGALCVCHSGQCLFSSMVGGRSGNRGECAQPCRLPYNGGHPLSLKDLSLAEHIPELIDSGVSSLKIEGRMKSPAYVYTVTKIYRRLLDEGRAATAKELSELRAVFSRDGFTDGYFTGKIKEKMTGMRSESEKSSVAEIKFELKKTPVRAECRIILGEPSSLTLTSGERTVTVTGAVPNTAENAPLS